MDIFFFEFAEKYTFSFLYTYYQCCECIAFDSDSRGRPSFQCILFLKTRLSFTSFYNLYKVLFFLILISSRSPSTPVALILCWASERCESQITWYIIIHSIVIRKTTIDTIRWKMNDFWIFDNILWNLLLCSACFFSRRNLKGNLSSRETEQLKQNLILISCMRQSETVAGSLFFFHIFFWGICIKKKVEHQIIERVESCQCLERYAKCWI